MTSRNQNMNTQKILPKLVAMSSYEIYLNQVKSAIESIRFQAKGMDYLPPQLGGLKGQQTLLDKTLVLQLIDFEVSQ